LKIGSKCSINPWINRERIQQFEEQLLIKHDELAIVEAGLDIKKGYSAYLQTSYLCPECKKFV